MYCTEQTIREITCELEHRTLSPNACFADESKGRLTPEEECPVRTCFQRDRDRIIHSSSFRRLKHKTQVFLSPEGDYYRTRLTHTLEVSQIARTIAGALRLNCDLTEAIALGHDLGHTPFGHAGERALNEVCPDGFAHYKQSLRVVDYIEKEGKGLNLSQEVRDGILCHTKGTEAKTLEGRIVRLADRIAYINHDIDDACRAGIMCEDDIPVEYRNILGYSKAKRINTLVTDCIRNSGDDIGMSDKISEALTGLHDFMFETVYTNPACKSEESKAMDMIEKLYEHFGSNPDYLPMQFGMLAIRDGMDTAVCDFIAGMTDRYAVRVFKDLYIPKGWAQIDDDF